MRSNLLIQFRELVKTREDEDEPMTLEDFHVFMMNELPSLKAARAKVSGYEATRSEDKGRGGSDVIAAIAPANHGERAGKGNFTHKLLCYGCNRQGHNGDGCYKRGAVGFNTDSTISWPESVNGKILMQMGYEVLDGNKVNYKRQYTDASAAAKRQRK